MIRLTEVEAFKAAVGRLAGIAGPVLSAGSHDFGAAALDALDLAPGATAEQVIATLIGSSAEVADLFDGGAAHRIDLGQPLPPTLASRFGVVLDIGTIEHVYDPWTCLRNYAAALRPGGALLLAAPTRGYFGHGLFSFHPTFFSRALAGNGFEILYEAFSDAYGAVLSRHQLFATQNDLLVWVVARKETQIHVFDGVFEELWPKLY